jgi:4-alpha-glucanotransferase
LPGSFGIGEIGDAAHGFVEWMVRANLGVWQFLPTGPTGYGDSPYQPLSTFAGNEMLIDVASLIRGGLVSSNEADSLIGLSSASVDYGSLIPKKTAMLQRAAGRFQVRADATKRAAYHAFLEESDARWLHDYALFRVLKSQHGERAWPEWPTEFAERDEKALARITSRHAADIENIKIVQFLFFDQWRRLHDFARLNNIQLFGDMPIGIALDSSDAWARRDILRVDAAGNPDRVAGVPPDYFSEDGQLWGNPLYDWEKHAANDYDWWIDRLRHSVTMSDLVRIDHFRGFESYWSVAADADTAREGEWLPGPGDDFFRAIQNALGHVPIVAEDLGIITPEVIALRDRHRIPGMKVLHFELADENFNIENIPEHCVCFTGTHDNDTTQGWFNGSPEDKRSEQEIQRTRELVLQATGGTPATIHSDVVRLAFRSRARIAVAPMQDFLGLGSEARLNTPGTSSGNWRWRLRDEDTGPAMTNRVAELAAGPDRGR